MHYYSVVLLHVLFVLERRVLSVHAMIVDVFFKLLNVFLRHVFNKLIVRPQIEATCESS